MATGTQMSVKDTDQVRDTEITLSTGKLLGIFFALAIICGVFFTIGYLLGKSTSAGGRTEIVATVPSSGAGKPYAGNRTPEAVTQTCPPGSPNCAAAASDTNASAKPADQPSTAQQSSGNKTADQSTPSAGTDAKTGASSSFMVQVAAVSKQEDAEILVTALRKKQYPVFIANAAGDPLFHVQVGPFSDRKDAEAMRTRLSGDGYNAIVK
ncbi:MAG TPA: SPOR domain-containing protein [Candidatus Binatia bacterium]|nr:SPOR domain-containing protein [Candidatus Binatia bacterium]